MTIDEAIEKYKRITGEYTFVHDIDGCLEVVQLVEWLRTARGSKSAARWYTAKLDQLEAENAKLREEVEQWHRLTAGIELPEYPITEFKPKDLERENAKLRELAVLNWEWAHSCCANSCKMQTDGCGYGIDRECNYEREIADLMRDLGIEVDE